MAGIIRTYDEFLKAELESNETQTQVQQLQDWLSGQQQVVRQTYETTAQTAAQQASYDISGAYANYLKQQRNIASQGHLESGYKEEVGEMLQQQYQSDYSQAKLTQAETTAKAYEFALKATEEHSDIYNKAITDLYAQAEQNAKNLDKFYQIVASDIGGVEDLSQLYTELGNGGLAAYDPKTRELTTRGKGLWAQWLSNENLSKTIMEEDEDLYDWMLSNYDKAYEYITGETTPISEEDALKMTYSGGYLETFEKPNADELLNAFTGKGKEKAVAELPSKIIEYGQTQLKLTDAELENAVSDALSQHAGTLTKLVADRSKADLQVRQKVIKDLSAYKVSDYATTTEYLNAIFTDLYKYSYFRDNKSLYSDVVDAITNGIQSYASKKYNK
jgi:hypothetical protein